MNTPAKNNDEYWMEQALAQAKKAADCDEVPVGAVIVKDDKLVASGWNQPISRTDPTSHAEIVVLRKAAQTLANYRLPGCTLYVTIEPCSMCVGAMIQARISRLVYGAPEPRTGAVVSAVELLSAPFHNHSIAVTAGILSTSCASLMTQFFRQKRCQQRDSKR